MYNQLTNVICAVTHTTEWSRPSSSTSPHLFKDADAQDIKFIDNSVKNDKCVMFIRKISKEFPDTVLREYIYNYSKETDDKLIVRIPPLFIFLQIKKYFYFCAYYGAPILFLSFLLYVFKYIL